MKLVTQKKKISLLELGRMAKKMWGVDNPKIREKIVKIVNQLVINEVSQNANRKKMV